MVERSPDSAPLLLFKSTYYPDFRRRILTILSLPKNATYAIDFDRKWIHGKVSECVENGDRLKGKEAYLIFLDYSNKPPKKFYPIRLCKVHNINPEEIYEITLKMGNFLTFKDDSNEEEFSKSVRGYLKNESLVDLKKKIVSKLVLFGGESVTKHLKEAKEKQEEIWRKIIDYLVEAKEIDSQSQFKKSLFFRFGMRDSETFKPLNITEGNYRLKPGKNYFLSFSVYQPHFDKFTKADIAKMIFGIEERVLRHVGEKVLRMPLNQRIYTKHFDLSVNDLTWGAKSAIVFEREEDEFNAPMCNIPVIVSKTVSKVLIKFLPFPVGLYLTVSPDAVAELVASLGGPLLPSILYTMLGIFLSSISLYQLRSK